MKAPGLCNRVPGCARPDGHNGACMGTGALEVFAKIAAGEGVEGEAAPARRFEDLRTSELLRKAASNLEASNGSIRADIELAGELRARALLIEGRSASVCDHGNPCPMLKDIGEVRS